jgi:hypothetical protein
MRELEKACFVFSLEIDKGYQCAIKATGNLSLLSLRLIRSHSNETASQEP